LRTHFTDGSIVRVSQIHRNKDTVVKLGKLTTHRRLAELLGHFRTSTA
jgi:hypothetical protein